LFSVNQWKNLLILVTSFTIGHSCTLAISTFNIFTIKQNYIEVLISLTIILTCLVNIRYRFLVSSPIDKKNNNYWFNYALALVFGLIHGMGFSYLLKSMLGKENSIIIPLFSFNIGLEFGQLIIVFSMLLISVFLVRFTRIKKHDVIYFISSAVFGIAFLLLIQRLNDL
jgi:hypothetical protein